MTATGTNADSASVILGLRATRTTFDSRRTPNKRRSEQQIN
jgi:hypothetical protein